MENLNCRFYSSPIGLLKIVATHQSVQAVVFVDDPQTDQRGSDSALLSQAAEELAQYFDGKRMAFTFPTSQLGTPFQTKVWNELLKITYGKTINYMDLAKRLGDPKAIRAAASTNGRNQLAIIVPCHRVIGTNGSLVGYAGGLWRKQWLLEHENKFANGVQTLF